MQCARKPSIQIAKSYRYAWINHLFHAQITYRNAKSSVFPLRNDVVSLWCICKVIENDTIKMWLKKSDWDSGWKGEIGTEQIANHSICWCVNLRNWFVSVMSSKRIDHQFDLDLCEFASLRAHIYFKIKAAENSFPIRNTINAGNEWSYREILIRNICTLKMQTHQMKVNSLLGG